MSYIRHDENDFRRIDTMGNTSERQIVIAILFMMLSNIFLATEEYWIFSAMAEKTTYLILYGIYLTLVGMFYLRNTYKIYFKKYNNILFQWVDPVLPELTHSLIFYYLVYTVTIANFHTLNAYIIMGVIGLAWSGLVVLVYVLFKKSLVRWMKSLPFIHEVVEWLELQPINDAHASEVKHGLILWTYYQFKRNANKKVQKKRKDKAERQKLIRWWERYYKNQEKEKRA
jgi:hypothetical protein